MAPDLNSNGVQLLDFFITWMLEISLYREKIVGTFSSSLGEEDQRSEKHSHWHVGSLLSLVLLSICASLIAPMIYVCLGEKQEEFNLFP